MIELLVTYWFGVETAVRAIAADSTATWSGLLLVLSAGLARNYGRRDLVREPWHLFTPLGASLATSFVLFAALFLVAALERSPLPEFFPAYAAFLRLYWFTAPLAWLYGVPFERWLPRDQVVTARLRTLALVAVWRVLLMIRVVYLLTSGTGSLPLLLVMLFAGAMAVAASSLLNAALRSYDGPALLVGAMMGIGGQTLRPDLRRLEMTVYGLGCFLTLALPLAFVGFVFRLPEARDWQLATFFRFPADPVPDRTHLVFSGAALAAWWGVWLWTLPKQRRATRVAAWLHDGRIAEAIDFLNARDSRDFPAQWQPPPAGKFSFTPGGGYLLLDIWSYLAGRPAAKWLRDRYLEQLKDFVRNPAWYWPDEERLDRVATLLPQLPEGRRLAAAAVAEIDKLAEHVRAFTEGVDSLEGLPADTPHRQQAVSALRRLAEEGP